MVRVELRRAFFSKAFLAACGISFVMLAIGGWDFYTFCIPGGILTTWWEEYIVSLTFGMTCQLAVFYPLVAMVPYVLSYRRERDSGYRQLMCLKSSVRAYLGAKILAVFCSAFAALLLSNLCWMLICRFVIGETDPIYEDFRHMIHFALPLYDNHPGWYCLMYAFHASVLGGIFALLGLGLSAVIRNRYLAVFLPFLYCIFSSSILSGFYDGFAALDLLPIQTYYYNRLLGFWEIPIYEAALAAVGLVLFLGGDRHGSKA